MKYYKNKIEIPPELLNKASLYEQLSFKNLDEYGFIKGELGDSLLFTSLLYTSADLPTLLSNNILNAEEEDGKFIRHPSLKNDAWKEEAASSTSKDMTIGLLWWACTYKRLDVANRIYNRLKSNKYQLGDYKPHTDPNTVAKWVGRMPKWLPEKVKLWAAINEPLSRVLYVPNLLTQVIYKLGGNWSLWSLIPDAVNSEATDYEAHLQGLGIGLRGELRGYITSSEVDALKKFHKREHENALFSALLALYVDPIYFTWAELTLSCERYFPSDRLPSNKDRKCRWLWERDKENNEDAHWEPEIETPLKVHSGGDYLFIIRLLLG